MRGGYGSVKWEGMVFMHRKTFARAALAGVIAAGAAGYSAAEEVRLISEDGTIDMTADFVSFDNNIYVVRTALGDLQVPGNLVRCEGPGCPGVEVVQANVKLYGSDTIADGLMPLLLEGYAVEREAAATLTPTATSGELLATLVGDDGYGDEIASITVNSSTSADGFERLLTKRANIGMSARRIQPDEARSLKDAGGGNMIAPGQEHILAVDSLVVILHPENPVTQLSVGELAGIYSGAIRNWSEVGGPSEEITVVHRATGSGTRQTFVDRIFAGQDPGISWSIRARDSEDMALLVNNNPWAIGYVGYAFQRGANAISLVNECGIAMVPDAFSARTEEYALQRRLYLYTRADMKDAQVADFVSYATSDAADAVIGKAGFIGLGIDRRGQDVGSARARQLRGPQADAYETAYARTMLEKMLQYDRLSTTFRFRTGSSRLDERGIVDVARLADHLGREDNISEVLFVGFTDNVGSFDSNLQLADARAAQVMEEVRTAAGDAADGIEMASLGYGEIAPSGCNVSEEGRRINRRVEVWVR